MRAESYNDDKYEKIDIKIIDASDAPKGKDVFYKCICGDIIPSIPKDNVGCKCGNVFIDIDYVRLVVENYSNFEVLRKLKN